MILGFKQKFPNGEETRFRDMILLRVKRHSIRKGYRWREGMSIQMAYGVRTKNYEQFNKSFPSLQMCKGVQDIVITHASSLIISIDGRLLGSTEIRKLITNDGLVWNEFVEWFVPNVGDQFCGQIIHWTDFKY